MQAAPAWPEPYLRAAKLPAPATGAAQDQVRNCSSSALPPVKEAADAAELRDSPGGGTCASPLGRTSLGLVWRKATPTKAGRRGGVTRLPGPAICWGLSPSHLQALLSSLPRAGHCAGG